MTFVACNAVIGHISIMTISAFSIASSTIMIMFIHMTALTVPRGMCFPVATGAIFIIITCYCHTLISMAFMAFSANRGRVFGGIIMAICSAGCIGISWRKVFMIIMSVAMARPAIGMRVVIATVAVRISTIQIFCMPGR